MSHAQNTVYFPIHGELPEYTEFIFLRGESFMNDGMTIPRPPRWWLVVPPEESSIGQDGSQLRRRDASRSGASQEF